MITRGLSTTSLITRGFGGEGGIVERIFREIIRLTSEITFFFTGTSEIESTVSKTSAIDKQNTVISKIDLEED